MDFENQNINKKLIPSFPTALEMNRIKIEKIKLMLNDKQNIQIKNKIQQEKQILQKQEIKISQTQIQRRSSSQDKSINYMQMTKNKYSQLNRFKKIKYLGRGHISDVYSVIDIKTGMVCALKIIQKSLINSKGVNNLLRNEIKLQMKLQHNNILKCYGVINDDKQIALILELSDQTLHQKIHKTNLSRSQIIDILHQILIAIDHMHKYGIIHRDIKSDNILISGSLIKLGDLGISIQAKESEQYCGTPGYIAPEIKLHKIYNNKIDCYSVGVLIYEMLYKKIPNQTIYPIKHDNDNLIDLMNNLIENDPDYRYNIEEALQHELFRNFVSYPKINLQMEKDIQKLLEL